MRAPEIPDDVTARDLDARARNELKTLSKDNADGVARHLVMAAQLIDDDPELAHEHAQAASRRAGRIPVVRETVAITAYRLGDYTLALRELRTYRRLSGRDDQIALLVDSERGLGRPDRALEEGRAVDRATLTPAVRAELAIAMSGARLDLGEPGRALAELDIPELDPDRAFEWSAALFAARAVVLEDLGRDDEAAEWRRRAEVAEDAFDALDPQADVLVVDDLAPEDESDDQPAAAPGTGVGEPASDDVVGDPELASGSVDGDGDRAPGGVVGDGEPASGGVGGLAFEGVGEAGETDPVAVRETGADEVAVAREIDDEAHDEAGDAAATAEASATAERAPADDLADSDEIGS